MLLPEDVSPSKEHRESLEGIGHIMPSQQPAKNIVISDIIESNPSISSKGTEKHYNKRNCLFNSWNAILRYVNSHGIHSDPINTIRNCSGISQ